MTFRNLRQVFAAASILAGLLFAADSPFLGTWKLNPAKSKLEGSGMGQATVMYESAGKGWKVSAKGVNAKGEPVDFGYTATLDGKAVPVTGSPILDSVSLKPMNDHAVMASGKKDGKTTWTDRRVVSADGKTMTMTRNGTGPDGKKYHAVAVFDKQ